MSFFAVTFTGSGFVGSVITSAGVTPPNATPLATTFKLGSNAMFLVIPSASYAKI